LQGHLTNALPPCQSWLGMLEHCVKETGEFLRAGSHQTLLPCHHVQKQIGGVCMWPEVGFGYGAQLY